MKKIAESGRLFVRMLNGTDAAQLLHIYSNKEAMRFRESKPLETLDDAVAFLRSAQAKNKTGKELRFAVVEKRSGMLMGTFLIKPLNEQTAEIGYSLGMEYWGNAYGKELVNLMMNWMAKAGYNKILARTKSENQASNQLLLKVGFKLQQSKVDQQVNHYEFSI
ncbi:MAG TPA: GNAT family N-acetyltransferase [Flavisolibacter sp.]|jgi:RimJ/RimL family protein N-acetyltransferase|nr:GNAT family N-acetyltransferase [Flavisolibacter sp.]